METKNKSGSFYVFILADEVAVSAVGRDIRKIISRSPTPVIAQPKKISVVIVDSALLVHTWTQTVGGEGGDNIE